MFLKYYLVKIWWQPKCAQNTEKKEAYFRMSEEDWGKLCIVWNVPKSKMVIMFGSFDVTISVMN